MHMKFDPAEASNGAGQVGVGPMRYLTANEADHGWRKVVQKAKFIDERESADAWKRFPLGIVDPLTPISFGLDRRIVRRNVFILIEPFALLPRPSTKAAVAKGIMNASNECFL